MADHQVLIDIFADARRTWDDVLTLTPDIRAGNGTLTHDGLVELERRVEAHRQAIDALQEALETEPADSPRPAQAGSHHRSG